MTSTVLPLRVVCDARCLADVSVRGYARYTIELLAALRERDEVELVLATDVPLDLPNDLTGLEIRTVGAGREWQREQRGLPKLVEDAGADVLLAPANRGLPLLGGPSVLTLHDAVEWDDEFVAAPRGRDRVRFGYASVASMLAATRIISVSSHAARELHDKLGLTADRVTVISEAPGRHFLEPTPEDEREKLRSSFDLPDRFMLYLGGFDPKKSVDTLVRAWASRESRDVPQLVLAGKMAGGEANALIEIAQQAGADTSRMSFLGYVPDDVVRALYAEAELFVFPAVAEGFGLPAVEAMACGTPTVVADAASLPEATRGGALRFPAKDSAALGLIIDRLFSDRRALTRLGDTGRAAVSTRTWDDVAAETERVLRDAANASLASRLVRSARSVRHVHRWVR